MTKQPITKFEHLLDASNLPSMIDKYGMEGAQAYFNARYEQKQPNGQAILTARKVWKKAM